MISIRHLALAALIAFPTAAAAQDYPSKPVRITVPNAVGGATDSTGRVFQKALESILPVPIVVVNKPGAGTSEGAREVREAEADGHHVLLTHQAMYTSTIMGLKDFGPEAFEPVAATGASGVGIAVRADSDYQSLDDLYQAAKESPDEIKAGVNVGALNHFVLAITADAGDAKLNFVHTGGGGPTNAALLGGHIEVAMVAIGDVAQYVESGDVRVIAVLGEERSDVLPNVSTAKEQGYDVNLPIVHVWYMPEGTPDARVETMANALEEAMNAEVVQDFFEATSTAPLFLKGDALDSYIEEEYANYRAVGDLVQQGQ